MKSKTLEVGRTYYSVGHGAEPNNCNVVSTWVYEGVVEEDCTADSCDVPYHFHRFVEWESWFKAKELPEGGSDIVTGINIASQQQALKSMLNWEELLDRLDTLKNWGLFS